MWLVYFKGDSSDLGVNVSSEEEAKTIVTEYEFMEYTFKEVVK